MISIELITYKHNTNGKRKQHKQTYEHMQTTHPNAKQPQTQNIRVKPPLFYDSGSVGDTR